MILDRIKNKAAKYGIEIRFVEELDSAKIVQLRTDAILSRFLHKTNPDIEEQKRYIRDYKIREQENLEYYFAFSLLGNKDAIGFYRLYNIDYITKSFTIGSWIFEQNIPQNIAILGDILAKEFGFDELNFDVCYFDVRRRNKKVLKYHNLFEPVFIREDDEENNYYFLTKVNFEKNKNEILNFLI